MPTPERMVTDAIRCNYGLDFHNSTHLRSLAAMGFSLLQGAKKKIQLVLKVPARAPLPEGVAASIGGGGPTAGMVAAAGQEGSSASAGAGKLQGRTPVQCKQTEKSSSPEMPAPALAEDKEVNARLEAAVVTVSGEPPGEGVLGGSGAGAAEQCVAGEAEAGRSRAEQMLELPQQLGGTMTALSRSLQNKLFLRLSFNSESSKELRRFKGWGILGLEKVGISNGGWCNLCLVCSYGVTTKLLMYWHIGKE
jgi:hypothetical protein